jgi:hypothetical protein
VQTAPSNSPRTDEAVQLLATWERLGVPGAIDVHTHFMPKAVMDKVWRYFDSVGPLTGSSWPITYRMAEDERVERLRSFGVRQFTAMIYPHKPQMAAWLNAWGADFAARTPECLHTSTFYPEPGVADYVGDAIAAGTRVFKAHLQVGDYDPNDPLLEPVWEQLAQSQVPLVIHCGSGPAPGRFTGPSHIRELLARHPQLPLIIAHLGMPEYDDFLDIAERYDHVHLDTTMAFTDFAEERMPFPKGQGARLRALGSKILLGSDFPNIPYDYLHQVEALERLDLGDQWLAEVVHTNAARLFEVDG